MRSITPPLAVCAAALLLPGAAGAARAAERPTAYNEMIALHAKAHGVPETFVHRMIMRESHYNPRIVHRHCYGLLQIKPATARSMGYKGPAQRLLDPETNLTYAVPYLANAYKIAGGNETRAMALFSSGYYYTAKRKKLLGELRTASSPELEVQSAQAKAPEAYP
jgi:soluble lytic murein transglycosylase-like protein